MLLRHRLVDGTACLDLRVRTLDQLYDPRAPAPMDGPAMNADAMDAIAALAEDIPPKTPLRIILHSPGPLPPRDEVDRLQDAVSVHFSLAAERSRRRLRRELRQARVKLFVGLFAFLVLLSGAELLRTVADAPGARLLPEGLVIVAWVVMWRPLDALLFDWWPLRAEWKLSLRLAEARLDVLPLSDEGPAP